MVVWGRIKAVQTKVPGGCAFLHVCLSWICQQHSYDAVHRLGGPGSVAEMTGRKGRIVGDKAGRGTYTLRASPDTQEMDSLNVNETCELWVPSPSCLPLNAALSNDPLEAHGVSPSQPEGPFCSPSQHQGKHSVCFLHLMSAASLA